MTLPTQMTPIARTIAVSRRVYGLGWRLSFAGIGPGSRARKRRWCGPCSPHCTPFALSEHQRGEWDEKAREQADRIHVFAREMLLRQSRAQNNAADSAQAKECDKAKAVQDFHRSIRCSNWDPILSPADYAR